MPYSHTSFSTLKTQLAGRLGDAGGVYWTDAERGIYIVEALRTWQALARYWRDRGTFVTAASTPFYDITTLLLKGTESLLSYSVTDRDLVQAIQYHLLESVASQSVWNGTDQFTLDDVARAIERRRDQFLSETGAVLTRFTQGVAAPPVARQALPQAVIDVRRAAFQEAVTNTVTPLWRVDEEQLAGGLSGWGRNPAVPEFYSVAVAPPIALSLAPVPIVSGTLDVIAVQSGAALDPAAANTILNIPDDFAWVVKWGALADLLGRDGQARDPARAAYSELRWQQGCELARAFPCVLAGEIQGQDMMSESLAGLDAGRHTWQTSTGQPDLIAPAGRNLVALANTPDGIYSVTLDVVRNAVVPVQDGDFIQLGRECLDVILDYAEHLAAFKLAGPEFEATGRAMENMLRQAAIYNEKLKANALFGKLMGAMSHREEERRPIRETVNA
jgi:hypothetical protein